MGGEPLLGKKGSSVVVEVVVVVVVLLLLLLVAAAAGDVGVVVVAAAAAAAAAAHVLGWSDAKRGRQKFHHSTFRRIGKTPLVFLCFVTVNHLLTMVQLLVLGLIAGVGPSNVFASASVVPDFGADFQPAQGPNMNGDFVLSTTPGGKEGLFPKTYTDFPGGVEAYDVLSPPITTLYSQVWWAPLAPVSFPEEMIAKYTNKTVAIVGWEIDQVRVLPDGTEHSVPISATYNHHYNLQIIGAAAQFKKIWLNGPHDPRAKELLRASHGMVAYDQPHYVPEIVGDTSRGPASAFVTSGNGGEYRKTFHGFAPGHAVVIDSPTQIQLSPMQIDTWNRDEMDISQPLPPKFVAGPLPRSSEAPVNASYSGLLECPMTTRLTKVVDGAYVVEGAGGVCAAPILTFQECFHAAASTLGNEGTPASQFKNTTGSAPQRPSGCSVSSSIDSGSGSNHIQVYFNELSNSTVGCAADAGIVSGAASSLVDVAVTLNATSKLATISLTGPSDVWFGVGFGAQAMADRPWTIVVDGNGNVSERHLGGESPNSHIAGDPLQPSVTVVGSSVASTLRTVVLTRPFQGAGPDYYTFNASASNMVLPFINAIGSGPDLAYVATHFVECAFDNFENCSMNDSPRLPSISAGTTKTRLRQSCRCFLDPPLRVHACAQKLLHLLAWQLGNWCTMQQISLVMWALVLLRSDNKNASRFQRLF